jgi:creatinine amidohydrolase
VAGDQIRATLTRPTFDWAESDMLTAPCGMVYRSIKEISGGSGVVGAPAYASADKGRRISDAVVAKLVQMLTDIRTVP